MTDIRHTEPLTDTLIRKLQDESGAAGDSHMDHLCSLALEGDEDGREACAEAINAARAMDEKASLKVIA